MRRDVGLLFFFDGHCADVGRVGVTFTKLQVFFGFFRQQAILFLYARQVLVRQFFDVHHFIMSAVSGADDLVKFQLDRDGAAVLTVLNDKKHDDGDNRRERTDHQMPGHAKMKRQSG